LNDTIFGFSSEEMSTHLEDASNTETKKLLQLLLALPEELCGIILRDPLTIHSTLSRATLVWQFNAELIHKLCGTTATSLVAHQSSGSAFNFLGLQYPQYKQEPSNSTSFIRIGVDHLGIRTVEVLEQYPTSDRHDNRSCLWYIVERQDYFTREIKHITVGPFSRLVSSGQSEIQMWDILNPPIRGSYHSVGLTTTSPRNTRCLDLRNAKGLTVFCTPESIYNIHVHQGNNTAVTSFRRLYYTHQRNAKWRYFPFHLDEVVTGAWIHRSSAPNSNGAILVISTSRNRFCYFGSPQRNGQLLCNAPIDCLLYDEPKLAAPISWFGAIPKSDSEIGSCHTSCRFPLPSLSEGNNTVFNYIYTCASLEHVVEAIVYSNGQGASTGILLKYSDNSFESVGQCRIGLDDTTITLFQLPSRIHFRQFSLGSREHVLVQFSHDHEVAEFQSQKMVGQIVWKLSLWKDIVQVLP